jgi:hypothetical protein
MLLHSPYEITVSDLLSKAAFEVIKFQMIYWLICKIVVNVTCK